MKGLDKVVISTQTHYSGLWNLSGFNWQPEAVSGMNLTCCGFCSRSF